MTTDAKRAAPNCLATSGNVAATLLRSESLKVALTIAMRRDKELWPNSLDRADAPTINFTHFV